MYIYINIYIYIYIYINTSIYILKKVDSQYVVSKYIRIETHLSKITTSMYLCIYNCLYLYTSIPANIYLFNNNRSIRKRCEVCSK